MAVAPERFNSGRMSSEESFHSNNNYGFFNAGNGTGSEGGPSVSYISPPGSNRRSGNGSEGRPPPPGTPASKIRRANVYANLMPGAPEKAPLPPNIFSYDVGDAGVLTRHFGPSTYTFPDEQVFGNFIKQILEDEISLEEHIGPGELGHIYFLEKGGKQFTLKYIQNNVHTDVTQGEIKILSSKPDILSGINLLAAQIMPDGAAFLLFDYTPSTYTFPDDQTFGDYIQALLGKKVFVKAQLGKGMSGLAYLVEKGGQQYVLKHVTHIKKVPVSAIYHEVNMLSRVKDKWWAVQLLAAQVMPDETALLLFPFIEGNELFDVIGKQMYDAVRIKAIFNKILDGLQELHKSGIIHRDIKPENIWVPKDPKLPPFFLDFGLSTLNDGIARPPAGTTIYARPEKYLTPVGTFRHELIVPTQNDNYYAYAKMANHLPAILDTRIVAQLKQVDMANNIVKNALNRGKVNGEGKLFGGSRRKKSRRHGRTRKHKK
jgi:predicted Ser/Thr protein kinase